MLAMVDAIREILAAIEAAEGRLMLRASPAVSA